MKKLYILRHAKSSWEKIDLADYDRALNQRGLEAASFMGYLFSEKQIQPDLILSSPAKRAKQTADLVKETAQFENRVQYEEKVYEASSLTLVQLISNIEDKIQTVLLIGHNPGLEGLIKFLTGETINMPTAGLVSLNLQIDCWNETTAGCGSLEFFISPNKK